MKLIILFATRQYTDFEGYVDIARENNTTFCDVFKSDCGLHNILAISL